MYFTVQSHVDASGLEAGRGLTRSSGAPPCPHLGLVRLKFSTCDMKAEKRANFVPMTPWL